METNQQVFLNEQEIKCIQKIDRRVLLVKATIRAVLVTLAALFLMILYDLIAYFSNIPRDFTIIMLIIGASACIAIMVFWGIEYLLLCHTIRKDASWQAILEKCSEATKVNQHIKEDAPKLKGLVGVYLVGNLMTRADELKKAGEAVRDLSGFLILILVYKQCKQISAFTEEIISQTQIKIKKYMPIRLALYIPAMILVIAPPILIAGNKSDRAERRAEIQAQLANHEHFEKVTVEKDRINIWTQAHHTSITLNLNSDYEITSMKYGGSFAKDIPLNEIIEVVNENLGLLDEVMMWADLECEHDAMKKSYTLSDEFLTQVEEKTPEDFENLDEVTVSDTDETGVHMYENISLVTDGLGHPGDTYSVYVSVEFSAYHH